MDLAIQAFLVAMAIVAGILSPFIIILLLNLINNFLIALAHRLNIIVEEVKKQPPFDEVEVNVSPATNVMTARFIKKGDIVWQGSSSRRDMERDGSLVFNTETSESA